MKLNFKIYVIGILLVFVNCNSDDNDQMKLILGPTSFSGRLLFEDTMEPAVTAELSIEPRDGQFIGGDVTLPAQTFMISDGSDGSFNIDFEANNDISEFGIAVEFRDENGIFLIAFTEINGLQCSPGDCRSYAAGLNHEDLEFIVPRPPESNGF